MTGSDDQEPRGSQGSPLWPVRAFIHGIVKVFLLVILAVRSFFRPRAIRYGALVLLLAGAIGWNYAGTALPRPQLPIVSAQTGDEIISVPATNQLIQAPVVERYLRAQAAFDARGMWDTISDEMKLQMNATDATVQQLQGELDSAKQSGRKYRGATYVGGVPTSDGRSVFFYVLTVDAPTGPADVPYIYVVGTDGKIVSIQ